MTSPPANNHPTGNLKEFVHFDFGNFDTLKKKMEEADAAIEEMIKKLRGYKIIQGVRGQDPVNEDLYADQIARVSALVQAAPEIAEMDLNPLLGSPTAVVAVDARIRIEK